MEGIEANSNLRLNLVVVFFFLVSTFPAPLHSLMCILNPNSHDTWKIKTSGSYSAVNCSTNNMKGKKICLQYVIYNMNYLAQELLTFFQLFQIYPDTGHSLSDVLPHFYKAMEDFLGEKECFAPLPKASMFTESKDARHRKEARVN